MTDTLIDPKEITAANPGRTFRLNTKNIGPWRNPTSEDKPAAFNEFGFMSVYKPTDPAKLESFYAEYEDTIQYHLALGHIVEDPMAKVTPIPVGPSTTGRTLSTKEATAELLADRKQQERAFQEHMTPKGDGATPAPITQKPNVGRTDKTNRTGGTFGPDGKPLR